MQVNVFNRFKLDTLNTKLLFALSKVQILLFMKILLGEQIHYPSKHALFLFVKCMQTSHDCLYTMFF